MQTFHVTDYKGLTKIIDQQNKTFKTVQDFITHFVDDGSKRRSILKVNLQFQVHLTHAYFRFLLLPMVLLP